MDGLLVLHLLERELITTGRPKRSQAEQRMTDYRVTFEYRERGRKARRRGSRVFKGYPNPEAVYRQMLSNLGFSSRVDELKIELKRLPAIKKARKRR